MSVPYSWIVYVQLRWPDNSIPTNQQISQVLAFESYGDTMQALCGAGLEADGICTLNFGRESFYPPRTNPTLTIKVFDTQGILLHTQEFADVVNESILPIIIGGGVSNDWRVSGTVKDASSVLVTSGSVRAFDTFYSPERLLGEQTISDTGTYEINYTSDTFGKTVEHSAPYLVVRAYDTDDTVIAEMTRSSPSQDEIVDLVVPASSDQWSVSGVIILDGSHLTSGMVTVFDCFENKEFSLGSATPDQNGQYRIVYLESDFQHGGSGRPSPNLIIRVYDSQNTQIGTGTIPSPSQHQVFDFNQSNLGELHTISGVVVNTKGVPVSGCTTIIKRISIINNQIKEDEIGRGTSNSKGQYTINYYPDLPPNIPDPGKANIYIEVQKRIGIEDVLLAKSDVINKPETVTTIDLTVDTISVSDLSELTDTVEVLTENGFTPELLRTIAVDDKKLQFVSKVTEKPKDEIYRIAYSMVLTQNLTEKLSSTSTSLNKVNYQTIYALIKTGNVKSYQDLYRIDSDRLHTILVSSISQSIIPPETQDDLEDIVNEWQEIQKEILTLETQKTNAGRLFNQAELPDTGDDTVKSRVLQSYVKSAHSLEKFWETLDEVLTEPSEKPYIDTLKFYFDIQKFADEFGPLSNAMIEHSKSAGFSTLEDFVSLEKGDWKTMVIDRILPFDQLTDPYEIVEWPESVPGETDSEKRNNYALILFRRITTLFPMDRFRFKLQLKLADPEAEIWAGWSSVFDFLQEHESFDFADEITLEILGYDEAMSIDEKRVLKDLYENLSLVQRLYRLTSDFIVVDGLIQHDLTSALAIAHLNTDDFVKNYSDLAGGVDDAQTLHAAAVHTASQTLFLMGTFNQQSDLSKTSLSAITEKLIEETTESPEETDPDISTTPESSSLMAAPMETSPTEITAAPLRALSVRTLSDGQQLTGKQIIPDIATLFGTQNQCKCQDCQSIFSPSAYNVDLLEFLNDHVRSVLFSRRPDLKETDLSCRNTNGPVAYIDLVNEILEDAVCSRSFYLVAPMETNPENPDEPEDVFSNYIDACLANQQDRASRDKITIPSPVLIEFSNRGFHLNSDAYIQPLAHSETTWYLICDSWRYLVESQNNDGLFKITPFPQTGKDAQLRRTRPEHTHRGAYEVLKYPPYPVLLPFSLAFQQVNEFLRLKNSSRHNLLQLLTSTSQTFDYTDQSQMQAYFEMTANQLGLIINDNATPWELWGLPERIYSGDDDEVGTLWYVYLSNAKEIMDRTGFTFDQFLDIFSTYTIWYKHNTIFIDDEKDDSIERGELSEILVKNTSSDLFFDLARFHRLCNHLGMDVLSVDRLLAMGTVQHAIDNDSNRTVPLSVNIDATTLSYLFLYLRIAEEFSVGPIQAAVWLSGWVDNFNLGRDQGSLLEQLFINTIENPERAAVWKEMLNDTVEPVDSRRFVVGDDVYGGDIGTLLKGLNVTYKELSLLVHYELVVTEYTDPVSEPDAKTLLDGRHLLISSLARMLRAADFSKTLGLTIKEFYKLLRIVRNKASIEPFTVEFLYECRALLRKIKQSGITLDKLDYMLTGNSVAGFSWLPDDGDELKLLVKVHSEIIRVVSGLGIGSGQVTTAVEEVVINELSSFCKIPVDTGRVLLQNLLYYSNSNQSKSLLNRWTEICRGGWHAEFQPGEGAHITKIVPSVNIVAKSEIDSEQLPPTAVAATWTSWLVVPQTAEYGFAVNIHYTKEKADDPDVTDLGAANVSIYDISTNEEVTDYNFVEGTVYKILVTWTAPEEPEEPARPKPENLNINCVWKNKASEDPIPSLLDETDTITGTAADLNRFVNAAWLLRVLNVKFDEITFLSNHRQSISNLNFNNLCSDSASYSGFIALIDTYILHSTLPFKKKNISLFDIWKQAYHWNDSTSQPEISRYIASVFDWNEHDITVLMTALRNYSYTDCRTTNMWFRLYDACTLLKKLGITAELGKSLLFEDDDTYSSDNTFEQSETLINALRAQFTQAKWAEVAEPVVDRLRTRQRDALCAYLLSDRYTGPISGASYSAEILHSLLGHKIGTSQAGLADRLESFKTLAGLPSGEQEIDEEVWNVLDGRTGFINRAGIYAKYLIDVSMEPVVKTTRIVQANSSIQMLIQRAILKFEPQIEINDKIKQQWSWMKNYRLWEANRKIFLYPENWIEPELRDDKTPLFKDLESGLLQKDLSKTNIEKAFKAYTGGLSEIANLEVIGAFSEDTQSEKILHVVGRTHHYPHSFYYRKNHDSTGGLGYWTPWEKVDLDITSDVVIPVPFRNKIYLFWPIVEIKEKEVENENGSLTDQKNPLYKDTFKYFELKLAWSEFSDGKWSAKRLSQETFIHLLKNIDDKFINPVDIFQFRAEVKSENVEIQVYAYSTIVESLKVKRLVVKNKTVRKLFKKIKRKRVQEIEDVITTEREEINKLAAFSFGIDNNATLIPVLNEPDLSKNGMIPEGTDLKQNRAIESDENQTKSDFGALEYPKKNTLLKRTPEYFACFPTNLSFLENSPKPFFLQLQGKVLFFKPVSSPEQNAESSKKLDNETTVYHQIANFYHPLSEDIVKRANFSSIDDLLTRSTQAYAKDQYPLGYATAGDAHAIHLGNLAFQYQYMPDLAIIGDYPFPVNDFNLKSAFGVYNWELFFHLPLYIAHRLSNDNQFEEAMRWFHFIFNPSGDFTTWEKCQRWIDDLPKGARFWNFLPFFANKGVQDTIYKSIEKSNIPEKDTLLGELIESWKSDPFKPHLIARVRVAAYQKSVIMKYLDNLIKWGDNLFRLDNMESINEATQLYTYASEILGKRPVLLPEIHEMPGLTYTQLKAEGLDYFSNAIIKLENYIPAPPPIKVRFWRAKQAPSRYYYYHYNYNYNYNYNSSVEAIPSRSMQLLRMAPALHYFCIPRNPRLLNYWDTVDDRLFKIRNSLNIDGVKREIPLFAPPIDPGMLVRAAAMGISIGALLKDFQSAPTVYRFSIIYQKAVELCSELKSFGSELLSALEKGDNEKLSLLRSAHEIEILNLVKDIKKKAVEEAAQNLESIQKSKETVAERHNYYKQIKAINSLEASQLLMMHNAQVLHMIGNSMTLASAALTPIPDTNVGVLVSMMGGPTMNAEIAGGKKASAALNLLGSAIMANAGFLDRDASLFGTMASFKRRSDDWKLEEALAEKELAQIEKQILAATIRVNIAEYELRNHEKQMEHAQLMKETMESKFSNEDLYQWMSDELNKSYNLLYDIAYNAAKKAERAFQFELGSKSSFVTPEIWDSTRKGLLAGQRLMIQLRQMDAAYIENNKREMEITKSVSLRLLQPERLLELQETGTCSFELPEILFDFDFPGHYFRRIKSVRITIPCITGPYTNVSARLKLTGSKIRTSTELKNGKYVITGDDDRFLNNPVNPMTIATSSAQMDSGMFELNFRDERYLPFEGAGAQSSWELELPGDYRQFDYRSISDVILHISYTAREASSVVFADTVKEYLGEYLENSSVIPNLISLRQAFPSQYETILSGSEATVTVDERFLPRLIVDCLKRKNSTFSMRNVSVYIVTEKPANADEMSLTIQLGDNSQPGIVTAFTECISALTFGGLDESSGYPLGEWIFSGFQKNDDDIVKDIYLCFNYPSVAETESTTTES